MDRKTLALFVLLANIIPIAPGVGTILYGTLTEGLDEDTKRKALINGIIQLSLWFGGFILGSIISAVLSAVTFGLGACCGLLVLVAAPLGGWIWAIVDGIRYYKELTTEEAG